MLTVEQSLRYASQIKNDRKREQEESRQHNYSSFHNANVPRVIKDLGLEKCAKTQVQYCSGGQRRRVSLAMELMFDPSILLLDEPTSGLDSLTSFNCLQLLKRLAENREKPMVMAIVIHQPPPKLLAFFNNLYIISTTGQCIYQGCTEAFLTKLKTMNMQCPTFYNPADFFIEIASGDYGLDTIKTLAKDHDENVQE